MSVDRYTFRAWLKEYKIMVDVARLNYDGSIEAALSADDDLSEFAPGEFELMQATGLLASKSYRGESEEDRMVFDGDVLTASSYPFQSDGVRNYDATVYWFEDTAQFGYELQCVNPKKRGISNDMCEGFGEHEESWEIIGTIHDTPKLLGSEGK